MADNDCRNATTDCAEVEGLFESAQVLIANANKLKAWINNDKDSKVELGGEMQPTLRGIIDAVDRLAGIATPEHLGAVKPDGETLTIDGAGTLKASSGKPDNVTVTVDEDGLLSALGGNLLLNSEAWITESGTFEAPVDGWYSIFAIDGGHGAAISQSNKSVMGGRSGDYKHALAYFAAGESIPIIVGAGGIGTTSFSGHEALAGGITSVGDVDFSRYKNHYLYGGYTYYSSSTGAYASGGGYGGQDQRERTGWYGGGGDAYIGINGVSPSVTNGNQGVVLILWHDPAKAAGPLPEPALLSARRMAPRAAAAPATVNLYDPETGQGSVWREEDADAKLAEGLITEEAWREICAAKAAEEYAAWLVDPETEEERFTMLRAARDAKLAATDYLVAPDYPLTDEQRATVIAYRQGLRDLPAQDGAPWDGGGEDTPWPTMPAIEKAE